MTWPQARARIKNRLAAVSLNTTLVDGTSYIETMRTVYEFVPQHPIEPSDLPACVMHGSPYAPRSGVSLLTEEYVEAIDLLVFDEDMGTAIEIIELFRPAIVAVFAADMRLNGNASSITLPQFERPEWANEMGIDAPGAIGCRFEIVVRLDAAQTYAA